MSHELKVSTGSGFECGRFGKDDTMVADFAQIYNADSFSHAMRARGVVRVVSSCRWEVPELLVQLTQARADEC